MKHRILVRLAAAGAASLALAALTAPAGADILDDLGIDLGQVLGGGKKGDSGSLSLAERILESELPRRVGPAKSYDVRLGRSGTDLLRGKLGSADVTGIDVRTQDGLVIPQMDLHLEDVRLGIASRTLDSVGKSDFSAALGAEGVTQYVRKRAGASVRDVSVRFRDGQIWVKGTPELMGVPLRSEVAGKPVISNRNTVDFSASQVSVLGLKLPRLAVNELERKVNPVVDLSGLKLPVRITELAVRGDRLVADGAADWGAPLRSRK